jgi:hypothetical protein
MKRRVVKIMIAAVFALVCIPTMRGGWGAIARFDLDNIGHIAQKQIKAQKARGCEGVPALPSGRIKARR